MTESISNGSLHELGKPSSSPFIAGNGLQAELHDLDPCEFDLPPVEQVQTLEEILGESDGDQAYLTCDELEFEGEGGGSSSGANDRDDVSDQSSLIGSTVSSRTAHRSNDWKKPKKQRRKSEILRFSRSKGISSQLASAASSERVKAGTPTALAVFSAQTIDGKSVPSMIAVGTSHGLLMVFDSIQQSLKYCIGNNKANAEFGRVSAVSFSRNGLRILVGYGKGHVQMIDSLTGKIVVTLRPEEAHQAGHGVVHLEFTDNASLAVCTDNGGSVFELRFSSGLTGSTVRCRCIFSGSRGEVCAIAPLHVPQKLRHTSKHYAEPLLLAMISLTKVMVVTLKPPTQVAFVTPFSGPAEAPPLLAWQWVPIQISATVKIIDPVLTFCRGHQMMFYQLHSSDGKSYRSFCLQRVELTFLPIAFQWLNSRCLAIVDEKENLHLQEAGVVAEGTLETVSASKVQLVYASPDFKGLATGGNVSEAMRVLADRAAYHSIASDSAGRIYVLGTNGVYVASLRTWLERVDALVEANDYPGAIQLALDFFSGKMKIGTGGGKGEGALSGSSGGSNRWKSIIADKAIELLLSYVDNSMSKDCPVGGKLELLQEHFKTVVPVCIDACASLGRWDLLYNEIYDRFSRDVVARGFFLECLEEFLLDGTLPDVPPALVQDYLFHLENEGLLGALESSIVRLPITTLDIHQVMTLCRTHGLYDGIIYVHNRALKDFLTPLEEMMEKLREAMESTELLSDQQIFLGNKILLYLSCCLCGSAYPIGALPPEEATNVSKAVYQFLISPKSQNSTIEEQKYPHLRLLLRFDTREFLNVLSMAFNSESFSGDTGKSRCQRMVDVLIQIVLGETDFSTLQMGGFFTFIVRLVVQQEGRLTVGKDVLHQLLEAVLTKGNVSVGTSSFEERQQAVLELLQAPPTARLLDKKILLEWAEKGKYLQICEFLYWKERSFDKVVDCYINDQFRKDQIFGLLRQLFSGPDILNSEKLALRRKLQHRLVEVSQIDPKQCAELLIDHLQNLLPSLSTQLKDHPQVLYELISSIFAYRKSNGHTSVCENEVVGRELAETFTTLTCQLSQDPLALILKFIMEWEIYTKKNEKILKICRDAGVFTAVVYLLEQREEFEEAFDVLCESLNLAMKQGKENALDCNKIRKSGREFLAFCQRTASLTIISEEKKHKFWFALLDSLLLLPSNELKENPDLTELLSDTVHAMIMFVKPADVLERLFNNPAFKSGMYSEYSEMINSILKSYEYETVLLEKVSSAISCDTHKELRNNWLELKAGLQPRNRVCNECHDTEDHSPTVLFSCHHLIHANCLQSRESLTKQQDGTPNWICSICSGKSKAVPVNPNTVPATKSQLISPGRRTSFITDSRKLSNLRLSDKRRQSQNPFDEGEENCVGGDTVFDALDFPLRLAPPRHT